MTQEDGGYELKPEEPKAVPVGGAGSGGSPKPGEPGWAPPVPIVEKAEEPEAAAQPVDPDVEKFKGMAILAYIFFLIPLIAAPNSKFARYHANQGLLLLITLGAWMVLVCVFFGGQLIVDRFFGKIWLLHGFFYVCLFGGANCVFDGLDRNDDFRDYPGGQRGQKTTAGDWAFHIDQVTVYVRT